VEVDLKLEPSGEGVVIAVAVPDAGLGVVKIGKVVLELYPD
jgi:hypothetical protein